MFDWSVFNQAENGRLLSEVKILRLKVQQLEAAANRPSQPQSLASTYSAVRGNLKPVIMPACAALAPTLIHAAPVVFRVSALASEPAPLVLRIHQGEWVETVHPGVHLTLAMNEHGETELRKVRFSTKAFSKADAEAWWRQNRASVMEHYTLVGSSSGAFKASIESLKQTSPCLAPAGDEGIFQPS